MKRTWWQAYLSFPASQRKGIVALSLLCFLLCLIRLALPFLIQPPSEKPDPALLAAVTQYLKTHPAADDSGDEERTGYATAPATLFPFDPNTLDSTGFITLGLKPKTVRMLLNWRRKGKVFYEKEDLRPLYTLKAEEYERLAPYIRIASAPERFATHFRKEPPLPATIDLNETDSATLVRLNGIGPTLAHRIIERRNALGGFLKHEQLHEVFRFPDTVFAMLRERLIIKPGSVRLLGLNTAGFDELKQHPYIGEKVARNILVYREGLKRFTEISQLRQVPLMNEEIYRKIAPYFTLQ